LKSTSGDTSSSTIDLARFLESPAPESSAMRETITRAARLAQVDIPVLLVGEPGAGKSTLARQMHKFASPEAPVVEVHLATLNPNLAEAELFGVEAGAFSGADHSRAGLLEKANGGTLILNEVGETPAEVQPKLLRALQERRVRRVGAANETVVKFKLICTSSHDLRDLVAAGRFRQDLFYRVAGAVVPIPPLRDRAEDLPQLSVSVLEEIGGVPRKLAPKALDRLVAHSWPGNLTELRAVLKRAALFAGERSEIEADDIEIARIAPSRLSATRLEERLIRPIASLTSEVEGRLRRSFGDLAWNERQRQLLAMLKRGDRITTREYIRLMKVSPRTGLRDLEQLVRRGKLRREGQKRGTSFRVM
jgi:two-component system response regulator PilR (NtrC family)